MMLQSRLLTRRFVARVRGYTTSSSVVVVPFRVDRDSAMALLADKGRPFAPTPPKETGVTKHQGSSVRAVFLPFHCFDIVVDIRYKGSVGFDRQVYNHSTKQYRTETDWYKVGGNTRGLRYHFDMKMMQAYADTRYAPELVKVARVHRAIGRGLEHTVGLDHVDADGKGLFDDGVESDPFTVRRSVSWHRVLARVKEDAHDHAGRQLKYHGRGGCSADSVSSVVVTSFRVRHKSTASVLLPVYILDYVVSGKGNNLRKAVGGVSGRLDGDLLYSPLKVGVAAACGGGLLGAIGEAALGVGALTFAPAAVAAVTVGLVGAFCALRAPHWSATHRRSSRRALEELQTQAEEQYSVRGVLDHDDETWDEDGYAPGEAESDSEEDEPQPSGFWAGLLHETRGHYTRVHARGGADFYDARARRRARLRAFYEARQQERAQANPAQEQKNQAKKAKQRGFVFDMAAARIHLRPLALDLGASLGEVKDAFRAKLMACHPDHRPKEEAEQANMETRAVIVAYRQLCKIAKQQRDR